MRFLERNLENIIWNDLPSCLDRGFGLEPFDRRYRQLSIGSVGIADLIYLSVEDAQVDIQIVECKKEVVNLATYGQACRYELALREAFSHHKMNEQELCLSKVLVGQKVDERGDFWSVIASDPTVSVFTYDYNSDGIHFEQHIASLHLAKRFGCARVLGQDLLKDASALVEQSYEKDWASMNEFLSDRLVFGDTSKPILITSNGILANEKLLAKDIPKGFDIPKEFSDYFSV